MWVFEKGNWERKCKCSKEMKVVTLEMKCQLNMNGIIKPRADLGNVDMLLFKRLHMKPEDSREGKLININEKRCHDKCDEDVPEEVTMTEKATSRRTSESDAN